MKAEDLMVGDWVNLNFDVDYKTGNSIYGHVQVASINKDGTIDVDCTFDNSKSMQDGWYLKLIEPIPLTPEILEKNGFEKHINDTRMFFQHDEYHLSYYIVNKHFTIYNQIDGSLIQRVIVNVHELQHALKLCGIDKEIVL